MKRFEMVAVVCGCVLGLACAFGMGDAMGWGAAGFLGVAFVLQLVRIEIERQRLGA